MTGYGTSCTRGALISTLRDNLDDLRVPRATDSRSSGDGLLNTASVNQQGGSASMAAQREMGIQIVDIMKERKMAASKIRRQIHHGEIL